MKKTFVISSIAISFLLTGCFNFKFGNKSSGTNSSSSSQSGSSSSNGSSSSSSSESNTDILPVGGDEITSSATMNTYPSGGDITIYYTKNLVDIPYVEFNEAYITHYVYSFYGIGNLSYFTLTPTKVSESVYRFTNSVGMFEFNTSLNTITVTNPIYTLFATATCYKDGNNISVIATGSESDYVSINTIDSKQYHSADNVIFNLGDYNINIFASSDNIYIPLSTFIDLFYNGNTYPAVFNGKDLYYSDALSSKDVSNTSSYTYKFYHTSPWYNKSTRSSTLAAFTYNDFCFSLDYFYGLKGFRGVTNFDQYFTSNGYKNDLLSSNTATYKQAMQRFVGKWMYEGHSGYTLPTPFQPNVDDRDALSNGYLDNTKYQNLWGAHDDIEAKRNAAGKDVGVSFSGNTAIITFDSFTKSSYTSAINVDYYTYKQLHDGIEGTLNPCSYLFFKKAFKDIANYGGIENVVIDVTFNGGGAVNALPWLFAFMTDDPFVICKNTLSNELNEIHYQVDLNQNGSFGDAGDTYKNDYKFFIMTSNFSFSCGNAFPTMAKAGGFATIIGETSGGGACAVGGITTASGTILRSSSVYQFGTYNAGTWTPNENGVTPDYSFPRANFYNDSAINTFVNSL